MLKINSVSLNPQTVNTEEEYKITVDAEATFYFNDLGTMTWDTVESRNLTWNNIDDSE